MKPLPPPKPAIKKTDWSKLIPRVLVGALTALVVARTLVAGDDPGRLRLTTGGGPLTLNLFALILLLGWSVWNGVSRRRPVFGLVTICLLAVAGQFFLSTIVVADYQRPGWFIAWESVTVAVIFYLTRQLADYPGASTGLLGAVLASAVSLSALAVYQEISPALGLPSAEIPKPGVMPPLVGDEEFPVNVNWPGETLPPRWRPFAGFSRAETFTGFLLLALPLLIWAGWMGVRDGSRRGWLVFACALATVIACSLTLPAILRDRRPDDNLAYMLWQVVSDTQSVTKAFPRSGWFGFGLDWSVEGVPVSYGWLGIGLVVGLPALLALFAAMGLVGWQTHRARLQPLPAQPTPATEGSAAPRWEFYLGGVAGLLLGFMLSTGDIPAELPPNVVLHAGVVAAVRSLVWFAVFALFESIIWRQHFVAYLCLLGLAVAALFGCFSATVALAPVSWIFWVIAAIALNLARPGSEPMPAVRTASFLPWAVAPIALALVIANIIQAALPGLSTAHAVREARAASRLFPDRARMAETETGARRPQMIALADKYLNVLILEPLRGAARQDPDNAPLLLELARWSRPHWRYQLQLHEEKKAAELSRQILYWTDRATKLQPKHRAPKWSTVEALLLFLAESKTLREERLTALQKVLGQLGAGRYLEEELPWRHRVVIALLAQLDKPSPDRSEAEKQLLRSLLESQAAALLERDQLSRSRRESWPPRLSGAERERLLKRLRDLFPQPSPELQGVLDKESGPKEKPAD